MSYQSKIEELIAQRDEFKRQRDELLAASKAVTEIEERIKKGERILYGEYAPAYTALNAAIARAEAKQ